MPLTTIVNDIADVPDSVRDYYQKTNDGRHALVLDGEPVGYVKAAKLAEFRTNNRALNAAKTELEAKLTTYEGIDADAARAALAELADTEIVDSDEVEKAVAAAKAELTTQHAADLGAQTKRTAELEAQLAEEKSAHGKTQLRNTVAVEFLRAGGRESAVDFVVANAEKTFSMTDGKLSTTAFSAKNPGEPLSVEEWTTQQMATADFAFKPSRGGGALSSTSSPAKRTISSDPTEFGRNLEAIANGDVTVL